MARRIQRVGRSDLEWGVYDYPFARGVKITIRRAGYGPYQRLQLRRGQRLMLHLAELSDKPLGEIAADPQALQEQIQEAVNSLPLGSLTEELQADLMGRYVAEEVALLVDSIEQAGPDYLIYDDETGEPLPFDPEQDAPIFDDDNVSAWIVSRAQEIEERYQEFLASAVEGLGSTSAQSGEAAEGTEAPLH